MRILLKYFQIKLNERGDIRMLKLKSLLASAIAASTLLSSTMSIPLSSTFAESNPILLGDVYGNGDGLTPSDAIAIQMFLSGNYNVTARQFTAMDVNQDGVVDNTDVDYLYYCLGRFISPGTTNRLYETPYNGTETYLKHTCGTGTASSSTSYVLAAPTATINNIDEYSVMSLNTPDVPDDTITGCVQLVSTYYDGTVKYGSGFIVDNNVIATAAHCLYSNGFVKNVTAYIHTKELYQGSLINVTYKTEAQTVHIPSDYVTLNNEYKVNFDYGLITFNEVSFHSSQNNSYSGNGIDIEDCIINLGVMSNYFADGYTGNSVTVTGYTSGSSGDTKYSSSGTLISMADNPAEYGYRFHSTAIFPAGKSGGVTYFDSFANNQTISNRTAVGINTHYSIDTLEAFGIRIDPSLIRFFKQNPNV